MQKFISKIFGLLFLLGMFLGFGFTQFVVPEYDEYVTDVAGVISDTEEEELEHLIYEMWQQTDVEMAVLFVDTLSGEAVWYAGVQVGEERGVGDADKDNGVVVLVAIGDRERTIQVGYGLEGTLPDAIAKRVGEANFPTAFREGDYAGGVYAGIEDLYKYIQADPSIMGQYADTASDYSALGNMYGRSLFFSVTLGIVYFFLGFFLSDKYILEKRKSIKEKRKVKKGGWQNYLIIGLIGTAILLLFTSKAIGSAIESFLIFLVSIGLASAPGGGNSGGSYKSGGYTSSSSRSSSSSSSSGSSFGGFSGGSFGGGGSSGKR